MYNIDIYIAPNGKSEIKEYINNLNIKKDKDSKIKYNKIIAYIRMLKINGLNLGEPYIKKQMQKTPRREIEKAKELLKDYKRRDEYE